MRVAVFGGTGFVGGYVVEALLDQGHEPSLLVRAGSEDKLSRRDDCRITGGDLESPDAVRATLEGCGAVIYLVGLLREFPFELFGLDREHLVRLIAEERVPVG